MSIADRLDQRVAGPEQTGVVPPKKRFRLPSDVRAQLSLDHHERALAWANDRSGRWYVGTDRALHLANGDGFRRIGWEQVERADWQRDTSTLSVVEVSPLGRARAAHGHRGRRSRAAARAAPRAGDQERRGHDLRPRPGPRRPVRRRPQVSVGDGPIVWSYLLAEGLDPPIRRSSMSPNARSRRPSRSSPASDGDRRSPQPRARSKPFRRTPDGLLTYPGCPAV